ncbi:MAG: DNA-directed DNA polymerase I [Thaumarchaeota archaeon]|nr:DNA-directed DNA polymerase I [Nitrososphaerota archaeon]
MQSQVTSEKINPQETQIGLLLSVDYDGKQKKAILKFLSSDGNSIIVIPDPYEHKPYCLSNLTKDELLKINELTSLPSFDHIEEVEKFDPLSQRPVKMSKIVVQDPLGISGKPSGTVKSVLKEVWEADIPYVLNYIYDLNLRPGHYYELNLTNNTFKPIPLSISQELEARLKQMSLSSHLIDSALVRDWAYYLEQPIPEIKRASLDIEVYSKDPNVLPNAETPEDKIISAAFVDSSGKKIILLLKRDNFSEVSFDKFDATVEFFDDEKQLLIRIFQVINSYPMIVTYNGDSFDLPYIKNRAKLLGIPDEEIPIKIGKTQDTADLRYGVHIDLYRFFLNRSIQIYAFSGAYKEATLDAVSNSLLGKGKVVVEKPIGELSYDALATYCMNDAEITMELTTFNDSLVIKLMLLLMRISRAPIEEIARHAVSSWIRSLFLALHRERNMLIPNNEDILKVKGETVTRATIKGKKYQGAIVLSPKPGAHFNVVVMDFASLYPSVIARFNLSYETVRCPHEECKSNKVADLPHWICTKVKGITSSAIGALRDLRVALYVPLSKDKSLPPKERKRYEVTQRALKVFLNASYGVMGAESFQFYTPAVAESVTALGRKILTSVIEEAQRRNLEVIYGDTDSVFLKNPKKEDIDALTNFAFSRFGIQLNFDKKYKYTVFSKRKKNYFGVTEDGIVDIKGLIGKKSSTPDYVKDLFFEVLKILSQVNNEREFDEATKNIEALLKKQVELLKKRQVPLEKLAFNIMMSKDIEDYKKTLPQHIKAAIMASKNGHMPKAGEVISYVKIKGKTGVKPTYLAKPEEVDVEKYLEILKTTFEQILEPLGLELLEEKKSSNLLDFM